MSRHAGPGCQKWSVLALKEILMKSAQDVTWWEVYQRPICAPGTIWNLFPFEEKILMDRQETVKHYSWDMSRGLGEKNNVEEKTVLRGLKVILVFCFYYFI